MAAAYTKDQLLSFLQDLQIKYTSYTHPVALTVEAQAKYVGHLGGGLTKNLFLKDKKHRFYIVSALVGTTVDLKVLSQRLGLGKGGLRMAPEESIQDLLKVPLGCVTPFALINDSARSVSLLLDQGFKAQLFCLFHPLSNDVTISLNTCGFDKFLVAIGRNPVYIDLEATPLVGKDQPPDLASFVPSDAVDEQPGKVVIKQTSAENHVAEVYKSTNFSKADAIPQPSQVKRNMVISSNNMTTLPKAADIRILIDEIIEKTTAAVLNEVTGGSREHKMEELASIHDEVRKSIGPNIESMAMSFKNAAYTEGFHSGVSSVLLRGLRRSPFLE